MNDPFNIFTQLPDALDGEVVDELLSGHHVRIERIVSKGQVSSEDDWYDQEDNEWVLVLSGAGRILFADGREVRLEPGDSLHIAAHERHRVTWTDPAQLTLWLAVFYS